MTVGNGKTIPDPEYTQIKDKLGYFRYKEKMRFTDAQMAGEPIETIHFALAVWAAEARRDNIENRKREAAAEEQRNKYERPS